MSLLRIGIGRAEIIGAIEAVKEMKNPPLRQASKNTYILCPREETLWDLKLVIRYSLEQKNIVKYFVTTTYQSALSELGFIQVKFKAEHKRTLGIRGYDGKAVLEDHVVIFPAGDEIENGAAPIFNEEKYTERTSVIRIRNSIYPKQVRAMANGRCEACHEQTFRTRNGEWFLEVHHKKWLSEGGIDEIENMVALCPNCHRQEHYGVSRHYF